MSLQDHPTVKRYYEKKSGAAPIDPKPPLDSAWVRQVVLDAGADDAGLASIDSPVLAEYRSKFLTVFPDARTCISVACRENFPNLEMWYIHHKPIAVAAGLGRMGLHHLVVHERFGSKMALSSILLDREVTEYGQPLEYDPCCKCMLCVTACPVGAINADGYLNAYACYKTIKYVHGCTRPTSAAKFLENLPLAFQRNQSEGLNAVYHVSFTGAETCQATITIRDKKLEVSDGLNGTADMRITADAGTWLKILRGEKNLLLALLTRRVRVRGPKALLKSFARCFPA